MIIVISGPGGVGKGTIVERLLDRHASLELSRSWTTRERRPGESPEAYHFVDRSAFEAHARAGGFLEWVEFLDYLQGSPVPEDGGSGDTVFEIDVKGAESILSDHPEALFIFIDAPTREEQRKRMMGRGDDEEHIVRRLEHGTTERRSAEALGATLVVNDDLERAVEEVERLIGEHRAVVGGRGC